MKGGIVEQSSQPKDLIRKERGKTEETREKGTGDPLRRGEARNRGGKKGFNTLENFRRN